MTDGTTIAAIASAPGPGERGVIRVSGPLAARIVAASCRAEDAPLAPRARGAYPARFHDGRGEQPALVLWMPAPRSLTREDVAELHLPGSPPLLACALERVLALGARVAEPGEFTRRAFESGRIDLTRAEGVAALVDARNREERRAASALLAGGLERRAEELREGLDELRALCEASLDFDEGDTGHVPTEELGARARALEARLAEASAWEERRAAPGGEPRVVLAGAANAGKSSLFNRLGGDEERALVSEHAGTTRDALVRPWTLEGLACELVDTAGVAPGAEGPDRESQERAARLREEADLVLWVVDAAAPAAERPPPGALVAWNQTDRPQAAPEPPAEWGLGPGEGVAVSARTGAGLATLAAAVRARLAAGTASGLARELAARHRRALARAARELARARRGLERGTPLDAVAESLRGATAALDGVSGRTTPEDLLDRIFARFCLGK